MLRMSTAGLRTHRQYRKSTNADIAVLREDIFDYLHEVLAQSISGRLVVLGEAPSTEDNVEEG